MIRFLQISDIHFSNVPGSDDDYAQMKFKFLEDIAKCHREKGVIDYVLICGDIAFSGTEAQYKEARDFINDICFKIECDSANVFVVPGNHDKKREVYTRTRSLLREQLMKGETTKQVIGAKVNEPMTIGILYAPFKQFYKLAAEYSSISDIARKSQVFPESNQETGSVPKFEPGDLMYWTEPIGNLQGIPVTLHGSNSSLLSDKDDGESTSLDKEKGQHLQVLPLQAYNVTTAENEIHIMMLHHPLSEIQDGETIGRVLDSRFQLQFYGHMHKQSSCSNGAVKIFSGAFQPPEAEGNNEYFPVYNIIELDVIEEEGKPCLKVDIFSRKWDGASFKEYNDETKTGAYALKVLLPQNDSWKETMERIKKGDREVGEMREAKPVVYPYAVKHAFLKCGKEGKIISEMYGNEFDSITPNRIKYLTFLKKVETDNRFDELNEILKKYGK